MGYDLPPSGLKQIRSEPFRRMKMIPAGRAEFATSPKHRTSHVKYVVSDLSALLFELLEYFDHDAGHVILLLMTTGKLARGLPQSVEDVFGRFV